MTLNRFKINPKTKRGLMNDSRVNFNLHDCSNLSIYGTLPNSNLYSYDPDLSEFSTNYVLYSFYYYENYNTSERGHYRYVQCKQNNTFQLVSDYDVYNVSCQDSILPNEDNVGFHEEQLQMLRARKSTTDDVNIAILDHTKYVSTGVYSLFYCVS